MDKFKVTQFESGPPWVPGLNSSGGSHIPNIRQFSDTSNVFQNSTQFGHYLPKIASVPQVKSLVLQDRISIPLQTPVASPKLLPVLPAYGLENALSNNLLLRFL